MSQFNGANRRQHERIEATIEVSMLSENNFYTGFTQDISEGGVFIASMDLLPIGSEVEFELRLAPGKGSVRVKGIVRWLREHNDLSTLGVNPGMGIQFVDLPSTVAQRINLFIKHRDSMFYDDEEL